ncbi:MAG: TSUP family transporter [Desulfovibrionaceae bacterium]|nr:TSUP family transporter [Desulfovibrionaceae bacterium]
MWEIELGVILVCGGAAMLGGFIDAIAGGGGLITMPALLLCGVPPHQALAANKVSACVGTAAALGNFMRSGLVLWRVALAGLGFSLAGAWVGSFLTLHIAPDVLGRILVVLLPAAMLATLFPPRARQEGGLAPVQGPRLWLTVPPLCLLIGVYDGFFGPGTGSFLILAFHWLLGMGLIHASATAKVLNLASNVGGSVTFIWHGKVVWPLALVMIACCVLGNWLGSRLAIRRGAGAVRGFLLVSLSLLMLTLIWEYFLA